MTTKDLVAKFGNPVDDHVTFENKWMTVFAPTSKPDHVPSKIYVNKLIVPSLTIIFKKLVDTGLANEIKTWDGCFCVRNQRGSTSISLHSFGLAIDINASWEGLNKNPTPDQRKTKWSDAFIKVWKDNGFEWGGDFSKRFDPMHFEFKM